MSKRPKDMYRDSGFFIEVTINDLYCKECHRKYDRFTIGANHVHSTCGLCNRKIENGLVFYK